MLETRKDTYGAFRKPTSIRYVTDMRYIRRIPEVQDCVSYFSGK